MAIAGREKMNDVKRYVNLAFIFAAIIMAWFFMKFSALVLGLAHVTDGRLMGEHVTYSTIAGVVLGAGTALALWRSSKIYEGAMKVAEEMKNVTWPTKDETLYAMKVVVATSLIVAAILFCFDFVAKELTDLILGIGL